MERNRYGQLNLIRLTRVVFSAKKPDSRDNGSRII